MYIKGLRRVSEGVLLVFHFPLSSIVLVLRVLLSCNLKVKEEQFYVLLLFLSFYKTATASSPFFSSSPFNQSKTLTSGRVLSYTDGNLPSALYFFLISVYKP